MSETKHTPGPWLVNGRAGFAWHVISEQGGQIAMVYGAHRVGEVVHDRADGLPNANLIAAAPDLYAALEWVCEHSRSACRHGDPCGECDLCVAHSALAKARGES